ncbi:hypothetical protein PVL29_000435 [Vitis rotundifolia]|uniref:SMP-30/Gluconolactonase/LRE-like region domain-containing protein n=1 Tax=Vitis rotundifolia TaxID=103349 RepID=A0AA39AJW6_VITRO|nr:hypothetical protein PVL29_000435 [Vitis rotundifolia]
MMSLKPSLASLIIFFLICVGTACASKPHIISFRSPNLYPEGITWDPIDQHFILGSLRHRTIYSVSDAGVVDTLISDLSLPENVTFLGLTPLPPYDALAAYDLRSRERLFLAPLHGDADLDSSLSRQIANDVTVDFAGNAYVTNAAANFIWKVNAKGEASIFSRSPVFTEYPVDRSSPYSFCGLNGILYISKGYLLVVQSNTGKMFKVDADDGTARLVLLPRDLPWADGIAVRKDGIVVVVSQSKAWFLKSDDSWAEGAIFDETALEPEWFPTSVTMGGDQRVYVIYGHMEEGIFRKGEREGKWEEKIWVYVLVGLGLAYFLFWRFQMKQLITNLDKKTN